MAAQATHPAIVEATGLGSACAVPERAVKPVPSLPQLNSSPAFAATATTVLLYVYVVFCLVWVVRLLLAYRGSSGDYRKQLKWLLSAGAFGVFGIGLEFFLSNTNSTALHAVGNVGLGPAETKVWSSPQLIRYHSISRSGPGQEMDVPSRVRLFDVGTFATSEPSWSPGHLIHRGPGYALEVVRLVAAEDGDVNGYLVVEAVSKM